MTRARVSMVGFEQRKVAPVSLLVKRKPPAAAFAVPCANYGQRVEAGIRMKPGREVSEDDLAAHCVARLGKFKSPDIIHVLKDLPKGPSGKVQRLKLFDLVHGDG